MRSSKASRHGKSRRIRNEIPPMSHDPRNDFDAFARWLARRQEAPPSVPDPRRQALLAAARGARAATLGAVDSRIGRVEVLQLLAAADRSTSAHPPELMTARGFRVTLAYDESG